MSNTDEADLPEPILDDPKPNLSGKDASLSPSDGSETEPQHYEVVPDGDVIFELDRNVSIRVSSVILSITSRYFKTMFTGDFREARAERSAINPQRLTSPEVDPHAMHRLFRLIHHKSDPEPPLPLTNLRKPGSQSSIVAATTRLVEFAKVCDRFDCAEPLTMVTKSLLSHFADTRLRAAMDFKAAVDLVSAAYWMHQPHYFRLFTKRLITDFTNDFGDALLLDDTSSNIRPCLERMSENVWLRLAESVRALGKGFCTAGTPCLATTRDHLLVQRLTDCLLSPGSKWPQQRQEGVSLRHLLGGLYRLEPIQRTLSCRAHTYMLDTVGFRDFANVCWEADTRLPLGLCLACTKGQRKQNSFRCSCNGVDTAGAARWVQGDSYQVSPQEVRERFYKGVFSLG